MRQKTELDKKLGWYKNCLSTLAESIDMGPKRDSRFFEGYTWVFEEDPMLGINLKGTPAEAVQKFAEYKARYWNRGRRIVVYTLENAQAAPERHEVTL